VFFLEVFRDVVDSVVRPARYAEFARRSGGRALVYLLLIALPLAVIGAVRVAHGINFATDSVAQTVAGLPDFRLTHDGLEFDGPEPYRITTPDGEEIGLIDTTGQTTDTVMAGRSAFILVLSDRMVVKTGNQVQTLFFADAVPPGGTATRAGLVMFLNRLAGLGTTAAVFSTTFSLLAKTVAALLLTLVVLIAGRAKNRRIEFTPAWNIACHALTLPLLLGFLRVLVGMNVRAFGLLYWGAALVYCLSAVGYLPPGSAQGPLHGQTPDGAGPDRPGGDPARTAAGPPDNGPAGSDTAGRVGRDAEDEDEDRSPVL